MKYITDTNNSIVVVAVVLI